MWERIRRYLLNRITLSGIGENGVAITRDVRWTGYSVAKDQEERASRLAALCSEAVTNPAWVAHDITGDGKNETFCNRMVRFICQGMGCFQWGPNDSANHILSVMEKDPQWRRIPISDVSKEAQKGRLVVLGCREDGHGHVVCGTPQNEQEGSWGLVPIVAHVGGLKEDGTPSNGLIRLSQAFRKEQQARIRAYKWEDPTL